MSFSSILSMSEFLRVHNAIVFHNSSSFCLKKKIQQKQQQQKKDVNPHTFAMPVQCSNQLRILGILII